MHGSWTVNSVVLDDTKLLATKRELELAVTNKETEHWLRQYGLRGEDIVEGRNPWTPDTELPLSDDLEPVLRILAGIGLLADIERALPRVSAKLGQEFQIAHWEVPEPQPKVLESDPFTIKCNVLIGCR
jgi:hypothetical protein